VNTAPKTRCSLQNKRRGKLRDEWSGHDRWLLRGSMLII